MNGDGEIKVQDEKAHFSSIKFPSALESMSAEHFKETSFQNTVTGGSMREPWDGETEIPFARTPLVTDECRLLLDKMKPVDLDRHSKDLHLNDDASALGFHSRHQGPKLDGIFRH